MRTIGDGDENLGAMTREQYWDLLETPGKYLDLLEDTELRNRICALLNELVDDLYVVING